MYGLNVNHWSSGLCRVDVDGARWICVGCHLRGIDLIEGQVELWEALHELFARLQTLLVQNKKATTKRFKEYCIMLLLALFSFERSWKTLRNACRYAFQQDYLSGENIFEEEVEHVVSWQLIMKSVLLLWTSFSDATKQNMSHLVKGIKLCWIYHTLHQKFMKYRHKDIFETIISMRQLKGIISFCRCFATRMEQMQRLRHLFCIRYNFYL